MMLNMLQCIGQLHPASNHLLQNVSAADIGRPWTKLIVFGIYNDHIESTIQYLLSVHHMSN